MAIPSLSRPAAKPMQDGNTNCGCVNGNGLDCRLTRLLFSYILERNFGPQFRFVISNANPWASKPIIPNS